MIVDFIREHADHQPTAGGLRWGVEPICAVLSEHGVKIAPSTYYEWRDKLPTKREERDAVLLGHIRRVHTDNFGVYGPRKVWLVLNREGISVARCTIERLMKTEGLAEAVRGKTKRTTIAGVGPKPADLVNRNFEPTAPNRLWVADFTYVSTWSGWCYVAFVIDAYARRILGWRTATTMTADLVLDAVEQAIWVREREDRADFTALVAHHDHGGQYLSLAHSQRLTDAGIRPSVGAVGSSYDCAGREHQRAVQDRSDPPPRPLAGRERRRDRHRPVGRLVQPPPAQRVRRRHATGRPRTGPLRSTTTRSSKLRSQQTESPDTPGCFYVVSRGAAGRALNSWRVT